MEQIAFVCQSKRERGRERESEREQNLLVGQVKETRGAASCRLSGAGEW